jgi:PAP2 superfamily
MKNHTPSTPRTKRHFLMAGASSAILAACGSNEDVTPATGSAQKLTEIEEKLPSVLTETTSREKSYFGDLAALINTLVQQLRFSKDDLLRWNKIAIDASGFDHTPAAPGEVRKSGEQLGPGRSSRAMAIVHIAMYDAVGAITGAYRTYSPVRRQYIYADISAAIAQSAHDTLAALYPAQAAIFAAALTRDLARNNPIEPLARAVGLSASSRLIGVTAGKEAAQAILADRATDGSAHPEPVYGVDFIPKAIKGVWSPDPITKAKKAVGAKWGEVRPFTLASADQFRCPSAPEFGSATYAAAYDEVQRLGGDGVVTATSRNADQTAAGIYWAYDGTPSLCAPPRLYNQIAVQIGNQKSSGTLATVRLLLLVNVSMADAAIAAWESKYFHQLWRPVVGLRANINGDAGGSATPNFTPLGAPASNLTSPNFTPPFPAYPSGHAVFGGALFQTLRKFYGTDNIPFTFVSDEYNGVTKDNTGTPRAYLPRSFGNLTKAEDENAQSRVYLGIHWAFDATEGMKQGHHVADWVSRKI